MTKCGTKTLDSKAEKKANDIKSPSFFYALGTIPGRFEVCPRSQAAVLA